MDDLVGGRAAHAGGGRHARDCSLYLGERSLLFVISLGALALVWASTVFCQVPLHRELEGGYDAVTIDRLVRTNGWRTFGWTVRGFCLVMLLIL